MKFASMTTAELKVLFQKTGDPQVKAELARRSNSKLW
jgi:hypothetical protein